MSYHNTQNKTVDQAKAKFFTPILLLRLDTLLTKKLAVLWSCVNFLEIIEYLNNSIGKILLVNILLVKQILLKLYMVNKIERFIHGIKLINFFYILKEAPAKISQLPQGVQ